MILMWPTVGSLDFFMESNHEMKGNEYYAFYTNKCEKKEVSILKIYSIASKSYHKEKSLYMMFSEAETPCWIFSISMYNFQNIRTMTRWMFIVSSGV